MLQFHMGLFTLPTLVTIANAISKEIDDKDLHKTLPQGLIAQKRVFEIICDHIEERGMVLSDNVVIPKNL